MDACAPQGAPNQLVTNINKEVICHKMVFESRNLGPSASNSACGSTKNMSHRAGCDLRLRSRVASTTPKTCFLVQYRHCELRNFKNHDPRNRNQEMIVSRCQQGQQMAATSLRCASHCSHLSLSPSFRCLCIPRTLSPYILPLFAHILSPLSVSVAISGH